MDNNGEKLYDQNMTYDLSISEEKKLVHIVLHGPYSVDLLNNLLERIYRNKGFHKSFRFLVDFTGVSYAPCDEDMAILSNFIFNKDIDYPSKVARVIKDKRLRNFYDQLSAKEAERGLSSGMFRNEKDALTWIES